jgi:magnesium transporter
LLYVLLDTIVGHYAREFDEVEDRVERLEEQLLHQPGRAALDQATLMKRHVLTLRRLIAPHREAFGVLAAADIPLIRDAEVEVYFRDLVDHLDEFIDRLDHARDVLTGAFNLYLSNISHRSNQELRVLTFLSAVLLPMTVITGLFGTNFALTEYQSWEPFYIMVVGMGVLAAGMLAYMRWRHWL